jgi:hypothetical protein
MDYREVDQLAYEVLNVKDAQDGKMGFVKKRIKLH